MPSREEVLVVPRRQLLTDPEWTGFRDSGLDDLLTGIRSGYRFRPRREVEEDASELQIIPYLVFRHDERYFLTRRLRRSSERRLRHLYSLGVGGHINPEDVEGTLGGAQILAEDSRRPVAVLLTKGVLGVK